MARWLMGVLIPVVIIACAGKNESVVTPAEPALSESERLVAWLDERYEEQLQNSPAMLTMLGRKEKYAEFDDVSEAAEQQQLDQYGQAVADMEQQFDYDKLDAEGKLAYDLWKYDYQASAGKAPYRAYEYFFNQMGGAHTDYPTFMISFHQVDSLEDMQAYIARLSPLSRAVSQILARAQASAEKGIRPPRFAYEGARDQAQKVISGYPFGEAAKEDGSPLWNDGLAKIQALNDADKITASQLEALMADLKTALLTDFEPAYQQLIAWLDADMANADAEARGAWALPGGAAYYQAALKKTTTEPLSAEQIHTIGLAEVARIRGEMLKIVEQVGFEGSLQDFFSFIRTDKQFFYPNNDEGRQGYLDDSDRYLSYIKSKLPDYFGRLPKADLVVKRVEAFREEDGAAQHYYAGAPDGSRPGIYYAHLSDMNAMPKNEMEAIAYHEGLPGHHMQIAIAQELEGVPQFQTQLHFTSYVEGWALYAETLAKEMGAYENAYTDFGRLITEMWRAIRLVVDTGMHAKGWTEQQAIDYFAENSPVAMTQIKSEVRRYLVWPGQATAYKIGMLKILELRAKAQQALGDRFDIRGFHDTLLGSGAVPLPLLEKMIDQWIASQQGALERKAA